MSCAGDARSLAAEISGETGVSFLIGSKINPTAMAHLTEQARIKRENYAPNPNSKSPIAAVGHAINAGIYDGRIFILDKLGESPTIRTIIAYRQEASEELERRKISNNGPSWMPDPAPDRYQYGRVLGQVRACDEMLEAAEATIEKTAQDMMKQGWPSRANLAGLVEPYYGKNGSIQEYDPAALQSMVYKDGGVTRAHCLAATGRWFTTDPDILALKTVNGYTVAEILIEGMADDLEVTKRQLADVANDLDSVQAELDYIQEERNVFERQLADSQAELGDVSDKLTVAENEIADLTSEKRDLEEEVQRLAAELDNYV